MALKSMTGYGRGESATKNRVWAVEIKCVNNRYLDAKIKLPRDYGALEELIRKKIGDYHRRGRVDMTLTVSGDVSDLVKVRLDTNLALEYKKALELLSGRLDLDCSLDAQMIATLPDVLVREQLPEDVELIGPVVELAVEKALVSCNDMREREAAALVDDLSNRLASFSVTLAEIEADIPTILTQRQELLKERLEKLLGTVNLDPMRLAQEVALLADKTDVTEEMVRLKSHISQFESLLDSSDQVGRKLDFLIQEFLREVNTLASKISDAAIAHKTVELKSELEKMREQVQNIE